ncbi:hypothetical protein P3T76_007155 [Phytophthora citrophthora]|uniref:Peptidase S54 rhomboid domain-containing protein n=1 Tax=Phytophthora citrophthora TaxID=4793 RepID=A0AAD9LNN8_9STRA|nr:hypothetical protein P3T76_007155 [Phytophthora citrophthora]
MQIHVNVASLGQVTVHDYPIHCNQHRVSLYCRVPVCTSASQQVRQNTHFRADTRRSESRRVGRRGAGPDIYQFRCVFLAGSVLRHLRHAIQRRDCAASSRARGRCSRTSLLPRNTCRLDDTNPLLTAVFSQATLGHFGANMIGLYFFGRQMCDVLGHKGFLGLCLVSGVLSSAAAVYEQHLSGRMTLNLCASEHPALSTRNSADLWHFAYSCLAGRLGLHLQKRVLVLDGKTRRH